ncbi:MAG: hypothetical protein KDD61_16820 [Bdellovibrionales bacterium]|nr:hypothetical protein [Bdellovibrionales bacterium]
MRIIWTFPFLLFLIVTADGAPNFKSASTNKKGLYLVDGVFQGGRTLIEGTSLLNIRRHYYPKQKTERLVFDMGDFFGRPLLNRVGHFYVKINKHRRSINIEFTDLKKLNMSKDKLLRVVAQSPLINDFTYSFDPLDHSFVLVLKMKENVAVEAFQLPSAQKASRIVLDIKVL